MPNYGHKWQASKDSEADFEQWLLINKDDSSFLLLLSPIS